MRKLSWARWFTSLTALVAFAAGFLAVVGSPAHAYSPNPHASWGIQDAGDCTLLGDSGNSGIGFNDSSKCWLSGYGSTRGAAYDPDSWNVMIGIYGYALGDTLGMVYFKASGEILEVCDMSNDGDGIYVWLNSGGWTGPYSAPGTSASTDCRSYDLSYAEGATVLFKITDDAAGNDVIASTSNGGEYVPWAEA